VVVVANGWAAGSRAVSGHFSSTVVTGPACVSPVGLCTEGTLLTGAIKGSFSFTATSLIQTVDTPTTGVVLYTGDLVVQATDGAFTCKDAGAVGATEQGPVASVCTIVSGTGAYAGVTGAQRFVGTFSASTGGSGDYTGSLTVN
jgi:hypothetical protein